MKNRFRYISYRKRIEPLKIKFYIIIFTLDLYAILSTPNNIQHILVSCLSRPYFQGSRVRSSSVIDSPSTNCSEHKFLSTFFSLFSYLFSYWRVYSYTISFSKRSFFLLDRYRSVIRFHWQRNRFTPWFYTLWSYWMFSRPVDIFNESHRPLFPSFAYFPNRCVLSVLFHFFLAILFSNDNYFSLNLVIVRTYQYWLSNYTVIHTYTLYIYSRNFVLIENSLDLKTVITHSKPFLLYIHALYRFNTPVIISFVGRSKVLLELIYFLFFCYCGCIILNNISFTSNIWVLLRIIFNIAYSICSK